MGNRCNLNSLITKERLLTMSQNSHQTKDPYYLGANLQLSIIQKKQNKSRLCEQFEQNLRDRLGIDAWHSESNAKFQSIFLCINLAKHEKILLENGCHKNENGYIADGRILLDILQCLERAIQQCELPPIDFEKATPTVYLQDYAIRKSSYIYSYIFEIQRSAFYEFYPNSDFMICFQSGNLKEPYYLIFDSQEALKRADQSQQKDAIIAFVDTYCKAHAPFSIFEKDKLLLPTVTTKEELKRRGLWESVIYNPSIFSRYPTTSPNTVTGSRKDTGS